MRPVAHSIFWLICLAASVAAAGDYSLVISNGRVIDPETGLDAIRHVGIRGDRIARVSTEALEGDREIDAAGLVVAPGFIDLHTHSPTALGQYFQLMDGVTTALELEAGAFPVGEYGGEIHQAPLSHFGASAGYLSMRLLVKDGLAVPDATASPWPVGVKGWWTAARAVFAGRDAALARTFTEPATPDERERLRSMLHEELDRGALGIGLALDYVSEAVDEDELAMILDVAGQRQAPVFVHVRRGINGDPAGLREVLALAERASAPLHVCHISHNGMKNTELFLSEIRAARARGVDVTTEVLPYNAGSTLISAAVFGRDWQTIFDITYEDVEWAATGERFDEAMWEEYRRRHPSGAVIHHYLEEAWTRRAIAEPGVMIVSDLLAMKSREEHVPPHNGAFARILGRYVREEPVLDLMTALSKMTLLPARRLERHAPVFRRKGRLQEGADADLTIFDPETVIDRATYRDPYQESAGIAHVLVSGVLVVEDGALVEAVHPGRRLEARARE